MIRRIVSRALLVRSVAYGEADIVATFFTRENGKLAAMVRGARTSSKRFSGALEPIHELVVTLEDKGKELCVLKESRIQRPRTKIVLSLTAMEAAGQALRWLRHLCPPRTPEPSAWRSLEHMLDALDEDVPGSNAPEDGVSPKDGSSRDGDARRLLAIFGLRLLTDMGYALELDRCVRCGRVCPEGRSAFVDAAGGGIICTSCGGAPRTIRGDVRAFAARAQRGEAVPLSWEMSGEIIAIVEDAMAAHAGFDPNA